MRSFAWGAGGPAGSPACRSPLRAPGRGAAPSGAAPQQVWVGWSQGGCCTGRDPRVVALRLSLYQGPLGIQRSHPSAGPSPRSAHFTHGPSLLQEIHSGTISGKVGGLGGFLEEVLAKLSLGGWLPTCRLPTKSSLQFLRILITDLRGVGDSDGEPGHQLSS